MKFRLQSLTLGFKRETDVIPLTDLSYFYGQMGAGKTSIARLIDYCLGGDLDLSAALQSEFVGASLEVALQRGVLSIERPRDSDRVIARWGAEDEFRQVNLPAREPGGEVVPETGVETLSDLLFWLSDITPPRVRRSKIKDETELVRLSMRDLLWYCYLDQDSMDNSFFNLDKNAHVWKRLKSLDVLRYIIGFHAERAAGIEAAIDELRIRRAGLGSSIAGLGQALQEVGVGTSEDLLFRIAEIQKKADNLAGELAAGREDKSAYTTHATERLQNDSKRLSEELSTVDRAVDDVCRAIDADQRHLYEIETLVLKFRRSVSARAVLSGVSFEVCPRCAKPLPPRSITECPVCGQNDNAETSDPAEIALLEADAKVRIGELKDVLDRHRKKLGVLRQERDSLIAHKYRIERERNGAWATYDTAYLSTFLSREREHASLLQEIENLNSLTKFPQLLDAQTRELEKLSLDEASLRKQLREAREAAERDSAGLDRLKVLFLDCLLRTRIPGIGQEDRVEIRSKDFLPEVYGPEALEAKVTSFANMSSGGKKSLFKCCFALAIHRVAAEKGATLPEFLLIDSPMKNISERENREQFESFHQMLYELKNGELRSTQMILIDKEFCEPPMDLPIEVSSRHMRPDDMKYPPLIRYYRGH